MIAYISTKYKGPSNVRGSRVTATAVTRLRSPERITASVSWDHSLSNEENHKQAVFAVMAKAGMIRGDYTLDGFRDEDHVGHWCAFSTFVASTMSEI